MTQPYFPLLQDVYYMDCNGRDEAALDEIMNHIDDCLLLGKFAHVDRLLAAVDVTRYSTTVLLAFLTASLAARDKLDAYAGLYERTKAELDLRDPKRTRKLLDGLEPCAKSRILPLIHQERLRQEQLKAAGKFAKTCADDMTNAERLAVLAEEFGEVAREVCEGLGGEHRPNLRVELIQVAAVCVAWVEGIDREERIAPSEPIQVTLDDGRRITAWKLLESDCAGESGD